MLPAWAPEPVADPRLLPPPPPILDPVSINGQGTSVAWEPSHEPRDTGTSSGCCSDFAGRCPCPTGADSGGKLFRIGNAGVTCTALRRSEDEQYRSMFDRAYDVVCRDAASPVGRIMYWTDQIARRRRYRAVAAMQLGSTTPSCRACQD